jgi:voltage-gated potassium channel
LNKKEVKMADLRNFIFGVSILFGLFIFGSYLFSALEGINLFESFYYVVLTITTVGAPLSPTTVNGKILAMILVFLGMGTVLYIVTFFASAVIEGQTRALIGGLKGGITRMKKVKNHFIVCGYGRLGKYVCEVLRNKKKRYIIIEKDPDVCKELLSNGESVLQGDALDSDVLKRVNIEKAKGLIATLKEDSDNIYLTITASELNPHLLLAAKAEDEHAVDRLHKVGAKIVVLPQVVGGKQLANAVLELDKTEELSTISKKNQSEID